MRVVILLFFFLVSCSSSVEKNGSNMDQDNIKKMGVGDIDSVLQKIKIDSSDYTVNVLDLHGTTFHILSREESGVGYDRVEKSIKKAWGTYVELFGKRISNVLIVDFKYPIGGGSLGEPFAVGIYTTNEISKDIQKYIQDITGWDRQKSTFDYIKKEYAKFEDPLQAYVDDIIFHELGHFLFGFGLTTTDLNNDSVSWMGLGMGMVYDRLIWEKYYNNPSPMFEGLVQQWKEKYSKISEIDQRLIGPDTTNDKKYDLIRLQVYNHGKAMVYLQALRKRVGENYFDKKLNLLLDENQGKLLDYDLLIRYLKMDKSKAELIASLEDEFVIK